jgi:hypothetical protein
MAAQWCQVITYHPAHLVINEHLLNILGYHTAVFIHFFHLISAAAAECQSAATFGRQNAFDYARRDAHIVLFKHIAQGSEVLPFGAIMH